MSIIPLNSQDFGDLATDILGGGHRMRFRAHGKSMLPFIRDGDILEIDRVDASVFRRGDIVLCDQGDSKLVLHRVIKRIKHESGYQFLLKGDALERADRIVCSEQILGRAISVQRGGKIIRLDRFRQRFSGVVWSLVTPIFRRSYWKARAFFCRIVP